MSTITRVGSDFAAQLAQSKVQYIKNQALSKDRELRAALSVETNLQAGSPRRQAIKQTVAHAALAEQLDQQLLALYMRANLDTKGQFAATELRSLSSIESAIAEYKAQVRAEEADLATNR